MFTATSQLALRARQLQRFSGSNHEYITRITATDIKFAQFVAKDIRPQRTAEEPFPGNWTLKPKSLTTFLTWWRAKANEYAATRTIRGVVPPVVGAPFAVPPLPAPPLLGVGVAHCGGGSSDGSVVYAGRAEEPGLDFIYAVDVVVNTDRLVVVGHLVKV